MAAAVLLVVVRGAAAENGAEFIRHTIPETFAAGTSVQALVQMKNTGTEPWTSEAGFALAVIGDPCGSFPHFPRIPAPPASHAVQPGESHYFTVLLLTQHLPDLCEVQFQMVQENVEFFGDVVTHQIETIGELRLPLQWLMADPQKLEGRFGFDIHVRDDRLLIWEYGTKNIYAYNTKGLLDSDKGFLFMIAPSGERGDPSFGANFTVMNQHILIASPDENSGAGVVYVYREQIGGPPQLVKTLENPLGGDGRFGTHLMPVGDDVLAISHPAQRTFWQGAGKVSLYNFDPASAEFGELLITLDAPIGDHYTQFGRVMLADGTRLFAVATTGTYIFDADPSSASFGSLLISLSAPQVPSGTPRNFTLFHQDNTLWQIGPSFIKKSDTSTGEHLDVLYISGSQTPGFALFDESLWILGGGVISRFDGPPADPPLITFRDFTHPHHLFAFMSKLIYHEDGFFIIPYPEDSRDVEKAGSVLVFEGLPSSNAAFEWAHYE